MCINEDYRILNPQELYNLLAKEKYEKDFNSFAEYLNEHYPLLFGKEPSETESDSVKVSKAKKDSANYISNKTFCIEFPEFESDFLCPPDSSDPSKLPHLRPQYEAFLRKCGWKTSYSKEDFKRVICDNDPRRPYIRICIKPINELDTFE